MKIATSRPAFLDIGLRKIALCMKLFIVFMLAACLQVSAKGYGQTKVTLQLKSVNLKEALHQLEKQAGIRFLYNDALIGNNQKVDINANNEALEKVLKAMFQGTGIQYKIMENDLVVLSAGTDRNDNQAEPIKGKVTGPNGEVVAGASVLLKGTKNGTSTNAQGEYVIAADAGAVLVFSSVGYDDVERAVGASTQLDVVLVASTKALEQVVVVGYGTSNRKDLTAPISVINTEDLVKRTTASPMGALQGTVPGVQVVTSGAPGAASTVRIRGVGSFSSENPLYVVDGIFLDNIDFLNPNDIAEMSILKDASGAAIYGVRAANGVVLITTKKGKYNMKTKITYNGYVGFQTPVHVLQMADAQQYSAMELAKGTTSDSAHVLLSVSKFGGSGLSPTTNTNWYNQILRNQALIHNNSLDVVGGSDKVTYALGLNYLEQNGILNAENSYKRYNIHFQTEAKLLPWLKAGFTINLSNSTLLSPQNSAFANAYYSSPLFPVLDPANTLATPTKYASSTSIGFNNGVYNNPVATAYYNYGRTKSFQILPTVYAEANFLNNKLTFRTQLSQRYQSNQTSVYLPQYYVDNIQKQTLSNLKSTQDRYTDYILDNLLTYKDGKNGHHWSVLLGQSSREQQWRQTWASADNVPANQESWYIGPNAGLNPLGAEDGSRNAGESYFARATYDYKNRYLLTATFRADGSSKYQTKWGYFPSVGLGWVVTQEDFMKHQNAFDFLKLRGSWGKLGNDAVPSNPGFARVSTGNDYSGVYGGTLLPGYVVGRNFSPNVKWEVVEEWDGGIDFSSVHQKLKGSIDYYNRTTNDLAFSKNFLVVGPIYGNWASMRNSGFEFNLTWADKIGQLGYQIGGNLSTLKNNVTSLGMGATNFTTGVSEFPTRMEVGQSANYFYGYEVAGIYQTQAEVDADPMAKGQGIKPGYFKFRDQNGNGILDIGDKVNLGSYLPKITYGFNLGLNYRNFDLSAVFQGVGGNKILNYNRALRLKYSDMNGDAKFVSGLWAGANSTNMYPSAYATTQAWNNQASSFFVESGAYLRVQNLQLGYNFKVKKGADIRVYATADRPFIFTKYSGFTPEVTSATIGDIQNKGYDFNIYPVSATYSFGVRITY